MNKSKWYINYSLGIKTTCFDEKFEPVLLNFESEDSEGFIPKILANLIHLISESKFPYDENKEKHIEYHTFLRKKYLKLDESLPTVYSPLNTNQK